MQTFFTEFGIKMQLEIRSWRALILPGRSAQTSSGCAQGRCKVAFVLSCAATVGVDLVAGKFFAPILLSTTMATNHFDINILYENRTTIRRLALAFFRFILFV